MYHNKCILSYSNWYFLWNKTWPLFRKYIVDVLFLLCSVFTVWVNFNHFFKNLHRHLQGWKRSMLSRIFSWQQRWPQSGSGSESDLGPFWSNRIGSGFYNSIVTGLNQDSRDTVAGLNQNSFLPFPFKIDLRWSARSIHLAAGFKRGVYI